MTDEERFCRMGKGTHLRERFVNTSVFETVYATRASALSQKWENGSPSVRLNQGCEPAESLTGKRD